MDYMKFQVQVIEAGQCIKRIAAFDLEQHAINFCDSLLPETVKTQFIVILRDTACIIYVKQGLKPITKPTIQHQLPLQDKRKVFVF